MKGELIDQSTALIVAEIDSQVATAKRYPRDHELFLARAEKMATINEDIAESCFYCLTRKSKDGTINEIKGPSIRLAEIAASAWGHIHCGSRIVSNDGKTIVVEGVAWDMETNLKVSKQISRSILTKEGYPFSQDMQVMTINAAQSVALRNAILSVVPRAFVDIIYEKARERAVGNLDKLNEKRENLFKRFKVLGIEESKILSFFEKGNKAEIGVEEIQYLIGVGTGIKEGWIKKDEAFSIQDDAIIDTTTSEKLDILKQKKASAVKPSTSNGQTQELKL